MPISYKLIVLLPILLSILVGASSAQSPPGPVKLSSDSAKVVFDRYKRYHLLAKDTSYVQYYLLRKQEREDPFYHSYTPQLTRHQRDSFKTVLTHTPKDSQKSVWYKIQIMDGDPYYKERYHKIKKQVEKEREFISRHPILTKLPPEMITRLFKEADKELDKRFHTKVWSR